ncbi:hypothetical protein [Streptomyces sp. PSKA30]|uniref:hypothetical protein n=1 Tax=Streptomyces sp. PSKA30 TaxID=2874597 RepID=UPI001CD13693|nr:hypothetical protein [Streptomyces sp. PSKA30]MBZ9638353.1 hypothetical protein [Streptomyces sp. PSKA30]
MSHVVKSKMRYAVLAVGVAALLGTAASTAQAAAPVAQKPAATVVSDGHVNTMICRYWCV